MYLLDDIHRNYINEYMFKENDILAIKSVAGSGKTTTLLNIAKKHSNKQILSIDDYVDQPKTAQVDWELDEHYREHLKQLGLIDERSDGEEFINYL
jgi:DNA transposition AAA+ family ATPase